MKTAALLVTLFVVLMGVGGCLDGRPGDDDQASPGSAVVSAVHPLAAEAGALMLRQGGNAVDAAAAVQWALNVVEPSMSGLGGGFMMLLWLNATTQLVVVDGREMAPAASTPDQFLAMDGSPQDFATAATRGYAVGVPGTLAGMDLAVREYGSMPLASTFAPAIKIARDGFVVDPYLADYISGSADELRSWPASARLLLQDPVCPPDPVPLSISGQAGCAGGTPLEAGQRFSNPDLAKTFEILQKDGLGAFYGGPIGQAIVAAQGARDGRMVLADLAKYEAKIRSPLSIQYGDFTVSSIPPPSAGGLTMLEMLGILEPFHLATTGHNTADTLHLMVESMHLAYQDRYAFIGDSDFVDVPMKGLLDPRFWDERRALIDPHRASTAPKAGDPWKYEGRSGAATPDAPTEFGMHTTHFTIVDRDGNVAAVTTTIESLFGTGMVVPGYGFFLNNELTDFSFQPGGPNQVEPLKRPRSSMAPTIVFEDGLPVAAFGSPGGTTITTTSLQITLNLFEHRHGLAQSVAESRIFSSDYPEVAWEEGLPKDVRDGLTGRGHHVADTARTIGNVQAIERVDGHWEGVADDRAGQGGVVYVGPDEVASTGPQGP